MKDVIIDEARTSFGETQDIGLVAKPLSLGDKIFRVCFAVFFGAFVIGVFGPFFLA